MGASIGLEKFALAISGCGGRFSVLNVGLRSPFEPLYTRPLSSAMSRDMIAMAKPVHPLAQTTYFHELIWPFILGAIDSLRTQRDALTTAESKAGLNFSIVLNSTCAIEGLLESGLKALLRLRG
jgi:hypothetical protein